MVWKLINTSSTDNSRGGIKAENVQCANLTIGIEMVKSIIYYVK